MTHTLSGAQINLQHSDSVLSTRKVLGVIDGVGTWRGFLILVAVPLRRGARLSSHLQPQHLVARAGGSVPEGELDLSDKKNP